MHTCNPDILGVEAGRPEVQGHPWLQKLRASLGYLRDPVSNFQYRKGNQNCKKTFPLEKQFKTETGDSQKEYKWSLTQIFTNLGCLTRMQID